MIARFWLGLALWMAAGLVWAVPTEDSLERLRLAWPSDAKAVTEALERDVRALERPGAEQPTLPVLARLYWMHGQAQLMTRGNCERAARDVAMADAFGLRQLWPGRYDAPFEQMNERLARCLPASRLAALRAEALSALSAGYDSPASRALAGDLLEALVRGTQAALEAPREAKSSGPSVETTPMSRDSVQGLDEVARVVATVLGLLVVPEMLCQALTGSSLQEQAVSAPWLVIAFPVLLMAVWSGAMQVLREVLQQGRRASRGVVAPDVVTRARAATQTLAQLRHRQARDERKKQPGRAPVIERLRPWD